MKTKAEMTVLMNREIADGIYALKLQYKKGEEPKVVTPGQFVGVYTKDAARLLPRPISICRYYPEEHALLLVYRVVGGGTLEFSQLKEGDTAFVVGVLGNGYDMDALAGKNVLLLGGGIGAPPLLELASRAMAQNIKLGKGSVTAALGYRTNDLFLKKEFGQVSRTIIATDDGSAGFHGNVIDAVKAQMAEGDMPHFDVICSCGPMPMLRGVKAFAEDLGIPAYISLEERMACGVGACLGCVTRTKHVDEHSKVNNARICTEGPVFPAEEVLI